MTDHLDAARAQARSVYEQDARQRKALALADAARSARDGAGFTGDEVAGFTDEQWALLEQAAGTRPASTATRALVVSIIRNAARRDREHTADEVFAKLRRGTGIDPFDGLTR